MGAQKIRQTLLALAIGGDGGPLVSPGPNRLTPGTGVTVANAGVPIRRARLYCTGVTVSVPQASDFGGTLIGTFAAANLAFLGARLVGTVTADANLAASLAAGTIDLAVGTAVASNVTLAGTMLDLVAKIDVPASGIVAGGGVTGQAASGDQVFLNVSGACTVDAVLTFNGYVDLFFVDTGA